MRIDEFDYLLPTDLIAQKPLERRDNSRLMLLNRTEGEIDHHVFYELPDLLKSGDLLVFNNSRVIPARLYGMKPDYARKIEFLLLRRLDACVWESLIRPGKKVKAGDSIRLPDSSIEDRLDRYIKVIERRSDGTSIVRLPDESVIEEFGQVPLPPYIKVPLLDAERYQTVYASVKGSVAAPTAGLHFSDTLLFQLKKRGVHIDCITLHIGLDTFRPVRVKDPRNHQIHTEYGEITAETAAALNEQRRSGNRIIAVGTSTVRLLEAASQNGNITQFKDWVKLFIMPGYQFQSVDAMITNFHLPRSTLLLLVSAFTGKDLLFSAYNQAIEHKYRFYSFGDCMLIQ